MAPLNSNIHDSYIESEDYKIERYFEDKEHCVEGHHIEDRNVEVNISGMFETILNIDYTKVVWRNVLLFTLLHIYSFYGVYLVFYEASWQLLAFSYGLYLLSVFGVTMGAHRLWAHRAYKANLPLRIILACCQSMAFQNDIYEWTRDHRNHHKFSETDADPHNANRGFFFAHIGWLMCNKHPEVIRKGKTIDMSDLTADPIVMFQRKYYLVSVLIFCFGLPTFVPWFLWNEDIWTALCIAGFLRYLVFLHVTWMVNSVAHWLGTKPYDSSISPTENLIVATLSLGEGWHNYHHVFPQDYRTGELGRYLNFNVTTNVIDFFYRLGWVWDLKVASEEVVKNRIRRAGDGSHKMSKISR